MWDVFKAEWQQKGRGGIRAIQLILGLFWPLIALSCMCLLLPHEAEGILEHLTLLILVEELEWRPQLAKGQRGSESTLPE